VLERTWVELSRCQGPGNRSRAPAGATPTPTTRA